MTDALTCDLAHALTHIGAESSFAQSRGYFSMRVMVIVASGLAVLVGVEGRAIAQDKPAVVQAQPLTSVTGVLKSVEAKPNVPGARCGYHFELVVASANGNVRIYIYDRAAPLERLDALVDRSVEIELNGGNVARSVHAAGVKPQAGDRLANLASVRHC